MARVIMPKLLDLHEVCGMLYVSGTQEQTPRCPYLGLSPYNIILLRWGSGGVRPRRCSRLWRQDYAQFGQNEGNRNRDRDRHSRRGAALLRPRTSISLGARARGGWMDILEGEREEWVTRVANHSYSGHYIKRTEICCSTRDTGGEGMSQLSL